MTNRCNVDPTCSLPEEVKKMNAKIDQYITSREQDNEVRDDYRGKQDRMYYALIGDDTLSRKGFIQEQADFNKEFRKKLDNDHDLLWWNRKLDEVWMIVKRPVFILLFIGLLSIIFGGDAIDYISDKFGVK